jgi:hypothetical protein
MLFYNGIVQQAVAQGYAAAVMAGMKASKERIHEYQSWYAGDQVIKLPDKLIHELQDLGLKSNFAAPIVDVMCGKLDLKSVSTPDARLQAVIEEEYEHNEIEQQSTAIHTETAICGDAYTLVWPEYDGFRMPTGHSMIRLLQSEDVDLTYDPKDLLHPIQAVRIWLEPRGEKTIVRKDTLTAFTVYRQISTGESSASWEDFTEDGLPAVVPNPLGEVPIVHFRMKFDALNRPFGVSQLEVAIAPMKDINGLIKDAMTRAYYNAGQQTVITGVDWKAFLKENPTGLDRSADSAHVWQNSAAKEYTLPGDQLTPFIELKNNRIADLATATATPMHYLDPKSQTLSGVALQEIDIAMQNKVTMAQTLLSNAYRQMFVLVAKIKGVALAPITVSWEEPYKAESAAADALLVRDGLMSRETFLRNRGLSEEEIVEELKLIDAQKQKTADEEVRKLEASSQTAGVTGAKEKPNERQ